MIGSITFAQHRISGLVLFFIVTLLMSMSARADFATTPVWEVTTGLSSPESVVYDTVRDRLYVSSVGTAEGGGYISAINGQVIEEQEVYYENG